jgi:hypothetical protein
MRDVRSARIVLVAASVVLSACSGVSRTKTSPATTVPTERCGTHMQTDFDPGLESRTVIAGPVAIVPSRVTSVPGGTSPARNFKLAVRLDANTDATLRTKTQGTSLMFDRARARQDNVYRLADGGKSVRLTGCPDRAALFVGAVLTTGPRTVDVDVATKGRRTAVTLTAFGE